MAKLTNPFAQAARKLKDIDFWLQEVTKDLESRKDRPRKVTTAVVILLGEELNPKYPKTGLHRLAFRIFSDATDAETPLKDIQFSLAMEAQRLMTYLTDKWFGGKSSKK